jgi:hypothetical protein
MNLVFVLNTYRDQADAALCLRELQQFYPLAQVLVISDLPPNRLKTCDHGGQWMLRYMQQFLATDGDVLIKIDPDSEVRRTVGAFPDAPIFGQVISGRLAGGTLGFSRAGVEQIVNSNLLLDPRYTDPLVYGYDRFGGRLLRPGEEREPRISCQDKILTDAVTRLGMVITPWPDSYSHAQWWIPAPQGTWAFVHPRYGRH